MEMGLSQYTNMLSTEITVDTLEWMEELLVSDISLSNVGKRFALICCLPRFRRPFVCFVFQTFDALVHEKTT